MVCDSHDMDEQTAFTHAGRVRHRVGYQTPEALMNKTMTKPYTPEEKAEIVRLVESRLRNFIIGDMAAHPSSCKCMPCFDKYYLTIDKPDNV